MTIAIRDDGFRKRLASKLKDLGEGRPRRKTSLLELLTVASAAEIITLHYRGTRRAHKASKPRLFDEIARLVGITPRQAKDRYYAGRESVADLLKAIPQLEHKAEKRS